MPRRSWSSTRSGLSTTRVLEGPYHTTQYTAMGVPFEALLPYGICLAVRQCPHAPPPQTPSLTRSMRSSSASPAPVSQRSETFRTVASAPDTPSTSGTDKVRNFSSRDNLMPCGNADSDFEVMDRDRRLTGWLRGQVDRPIAPAGFEYSNGWRVRGYPERRALASRTTEGLTYNNTGREELALEHATNTLNPYASHLLPLLYLFTPALNYATNAAFFRIPRPFTHTSTSCVIPTNIRLYIALLLSKHCLISRDLYVALRAEICLP